MAASDVTASVTPVTKKPWESRTLWTNVILAALALAVPGVSNFLKAHPEILTYAFLLANVILRLLTHGAISLED